MGWNILEESNLKGQDFLPTEYLPLVFWMDKDRFLVFWLSVIRPLRDAQAP
jgi:hypothetical protein